MNILIFIKMTYNKQYYLLNKDRLLLQNKEYRLRTNYDHMYNNIIIQCEKCNKVLRKKSLRYHYINDICKKYIEYNIIYQK